MTIKGRNTTIVSNRKAGFEYTLEDRLEAGILLTGTEVKSLRNGKVNLQEAYCAFQGEELFIWSMNIAEYTEGSYNNHVPTRERKLLLKKRELQKLKKAIEQKGYTIVPIKVFFNDRNLAKVEVALAKGKKIHDKRDSIKDRDSKRELDRHNKY
ncbi:MAG: SsrA-binding protein SmpB [Bacteroidia bacterium]|nr:SsrA-binding protein SmpB [Bacteroidia bacterium]